MATTRIFDARTAQYVSYSAHVHACCLNYTLILIPDDATASPAPRPCGCNDCQPQASEALSNPLQPQASGLPAPVSAFHGGGFASFPQSQQPQQQQQQHQLQPASRPVPNIMSEPQRYDPFKLPLPSSILQSQTNGSAPGDSTGSLPTYSSTPATLYQPASTSSSAVPAQLSFDLSSFGFHAPPSLADPGALRRSPYEAKPLGPNIPMSEPPVGSRSISPRRRTRPGDTSSSSSNGSPPRTDGGGDDRVDSPTPFINKVRLLALFARRQALIRSYTRLQLHFLLSNPQYDCIRWGSDGQSLIFAANSPDLVAAFSQVFRHRNINSFVRQLNICTLLHLLSWKSSFIDGSEPLTSSRQLQKAQRRRTARCITGHAADFDPSGRLDWLPT